MARSTVVRERTLSFVPSGGHTEADHESPIRMHGVYLGGGPRSIRRRVRVTQRREVREVHKGCPVSGYTECSGLSPPQNSGTV